MRVPAVVQGGTVAASTSSSIPQRFYDLNSSLQGLPNLGTSLNSSANLTTTLHPEVANDRRTPLDQDATATPAPTSGLSSMISTATTESAAIPDDTVGIDSYLSRQRELESATRQNINEHATAALLAKVDSRKQEAANRAEKAARSW